MSSDISAPSMSESVHGALRSSCHRMLSSVPFSSLVIEHFLNALTMIAGSIESHDDRWVNRVPRRFYPLCHDR